MANQNDSLRALNHDINSTLSSLLNAMELIKDEWKKNPELVDRILPLTEEKFHLLKEQWDFYRQLKK